MCKGMLKRNKYLEIFIIKCTEKLYSGCILYSFILDNFSIDICFFDQNSLILPYLYSELSLNYGEHVGN